MITTTIDTTTRVSYPGWIEKEIKRRCALTKPRPGFYDPTKAINQEFRFRPTEEVIPLEEKLSIGAERLGIHPETIKRMFRRAKKKPLLTDGGHWMLTRADIAWIRERRR